MSVYFPNKDKRRGKNKSNGNATLDADVIDPCDHHLDCLPGQCTPMIVFILQLSKEFHPNITNLSLFTFHHVVPNLYDFLFFLEHRRYIF